MKKKMIVFVRGVLPGGKLKTLRVEPDDTVYSVLLQIEDATGLVAILQRIRYLTSRAQSKELHYDTPGTLAEHEMVDPSHPDYTRTVDVSFSMWAWDRLQRRTLRNMGFDADDDQDRDDRSYMLGLHCSNKNVMLITVTDNIRMDGGDRKMSMFVSADGETVGDLMERTQRRRRYPVAIQEWMVRDADQPDRERYYRTMDKLDATLADYNVTEKSVIILRMNMESYSKVVREKREASRAENEIAAPAGDAEEK